MNNLGKLIVVEGPDGAGKSTACTFLKEIASNRGITLESVNILSGHPDSARMRAILTDKNSTLSDKAEFLLFSAAITNTLETVVNNKLLSGINVLLDRGPVSNFCYQVQSEFSDLYPLWKEIHRSTKIDNTLLITTSPEIGLSRVVSRGDAPDRMESKEMDSIVKMHHSFLSLQDLVFSTVVPRNMVGNLWTYRNDSALESLYSACKEFVINALGPK